MHCGDEIGQLLEGSWATLWSRYATELIFYKMPYGEKRALDGCLMHSGVMALEDNGKSKLSKYALQKLNVFQRFGMIYVSFTQDKNVVTAMVDRKDMTMKGSITT